MMLASYVNADQLVQQFKNPSFSGVGTSSHYLTIDNQEKARRDKIEEDIEAALKQAERDAENTTLAKFMRNLESRISLFILWYILTLASLPQETMWTILLT